MHRINHSGLLNNHYIEILSQYVFDGSLHNHFRSNFLIFYISMAKMVHSRVDKGTIKIIFMVIITHYEQTEMMIFFHL